ncbi:Nuclear_LIM interactor-interacting factor [Hexamita inflata]|uniref:Mitochondrial import inner membrane translocase subunit TIM50 n=1 Tax=Hexamita inflata TaxID=28002 RepID=A0AA86QV86_9EUKA|nr:Nuclear LIM interactor-interacting factor [Hexamita inflata]
MPGCFKSCKKQPEIQPQEDQNQEVIPAQINDQQTQEQQNEIEQSFKDKSLSKHLTLHRLSANDVVQDIQVVASEKHELWDLNMQSFKSTKSIGSPQALQNLDNMLASVISENKKVVDIDQPILVSTQHKPPKNQKYSKPVLVLDMDETLIHSSVEIVSQQHQVFKVPITPNTQHLQVDFSRKDCIPTYVQFRTNLFAFLKTVNQSYDIYIWTMGSQEYADLILDYISDKCLQLYSIKKIFKKRFYKSSCGEDGLKDLDNLDIDLQRVIAIDDSKKSFRLHPKNFIQIPPFTGEQDDCLQQLGQFLHDQAKHDDILQDLMIEWLE